MVGTFVSSSPDATPIEKGDVIAQIPWEYIISPDIKYKPYRYWSCRSIYNLARELKLGEKSNVAPYVRYLLSQPRGVMPGEWTDAGQDFLVRVLGHGDLPPYEDTWRTKFDTQWIEGCTGSDDDEYESAAYWLAASRDEDTLMVPIYDMANHSNDPKKLNTASYKPSEVGESFRFVATRRILPGEQIYNCYNRCNQCSGDVDPNFDRKKCDTFSFYRTSDLFVNFGFVEDYPQNWLIEVPTAPLDGAEDGSSDDDEEEEESELEFCLERDTESGELDAIWDEDGEPDERDAKWLKWQYQRLQKLYDEKETLEKELVVRDDDKKDDNGKKDEEEEASDGTSEKMTRWEWESIWRYHEALSRAIDAAIQSTVIEEEGDEEEGDEEEDGGRDEL